MKGPSLEKVYRGQRLRSGETDVTEMLAKDLNYAYVERDLGARVIKVPDPKLIRKAQGYGKRHGEG